MNYVRFLTFKTLKHNLSGHGKGRWQTKRGLIRSKHKRRKINNIAEDSRRVNW